jgi:hypothetical protein
MSYLDKKSYHIWSYSTGQVGLGGLQEVEFRVDGETTLDEMLQSFTDYLRATGFSFNGDIVVADSGEEPSKALGGEPVSGIKRQQTLPNIINIQDSKISGEDLAKALGGEPVDPAIAQPNE